MNNPKLFLIDVDDVLVDTPRLKEKLIEYAEEGEDLRNPELLIRLYDTEPGFLESLVHTNGKEFLQRYQGRCVLVSSAQSSESSSEAAKQHMVYQRLKIKLCGLTELVGGEEYVRVTKEGKAEVLSEFSGSDALFIDNDVRHLRDAHELGIETAHLLRAYKSNPEGLPEYYSEARFAVPNFEALIREIEKEQSE